MGTTCSSLVLLPEGALVAHVGDSRVYRVRDRRIDQLSFDHSLVWELVRRNHLTPEQANLSVPKNVITRSLGPEPNVEVDLEGPLAVRLADVYLLCSDGLSGPVNDHETRRLRRATSTPATPAAYLVHLANLARRAGQHHRPDRPHRPLGRSRFGGDDSPEISRRHATVTATAPHHPGATAWPAFSRPRESRPPP